MCFWEKKGMSFGTWFAKVKAFIEGIVTEPNFWLCTFAFFFGATAGYLCGVNFQVLPQPGTEEYDKWMTNVWKNAKFRVKEFREEGRAIGPCYEDFGGY